MGTKLMEGIIDEEIQIDILRSDNIIPNNNFKSVFV